jgi:REP element-mobilizing transposase RayT
MERAYSPFEWVTMPCTWAVGPGWYGNAPLALKNTMPQSLSFILVHFVFSTKERKPLLLAEHRPALHAYLATVVRNAGCECYRVGGTEDHVHLAVRLSRTMDAATLTEKMKTASSKWFKSTSSDLSDFAWQRGYGAFSVGPADLDALCQYIDGQEEHHRTRTFQDELRAFFTKYRMECDERYIWD